MVDSGAPIRYYITELTEESPSRRSSLWGLQEMAALGYGALAVEAAAQ